LVIVIVVIVVIVASGLVYAGVGGALGRWREDLNKPRGRPRDGGGDGRP
jgi:hypothetical protein